MPGTSAADVLISAKHYHICFMEAKKFFGGLRSGIQKGGSAF
jgi:hypothetical protein